MTPKRARPRRKTGYCLHNYVLNWNGLVNVYWLEQRNSDVPADDDWLGPGEISRLSQLRFEKRRRDWRLGRWTAKRAVATYLNLSASAHAFARIEIHPEPSGAPQVFLDNVRTWLSISISHSSGVAVCGLAPTREEIGCDLEVVEPRTDAFVTDFFAAPEYDLLQSVPCNQRSLVVALLWSAKESALKTLRCGLRLDTRRVIVRSIGFPVDESRSPVYSNPDSFYSYEGYRWYPLRVHYDCTQVFQGWWAHKENLIRTLITAALCNPPRRFGMLENYERSNRHTPDAKQVDAKRAAAESRRMRAATVN
jgi:4'-phosphopantetheinyl transferase